MTPNGSIRLVKATSASVAQPKPNNHLTY